MRIRKNDTVRVISGKDKGKEGKVIKVHSKEGKLLVQGINLVWKHMRRSQQHPHGARIQREAPIRIDNVMLICPNCNKVTRSSYQTVESVKKRVCRKCHQPIAEG